MIGWFYRYIFRGWGVLLAAGMITCLWLAWQIVDSQPQHSAEPARTVPEAAARPAGAPTGAQR